MRERRAIGKGDGAVGQDGPDDGVDLLENPEQSLLLREGDADLGGRRAADRYARRHGHRPKNDFGTSLFVCSVARMMRWARSVEAAGEARIVAVEPRYHPAWARWMVRVPGLREVVAWNAVIVLERL